MIIACPSGNSYKVQLESCLYEITCSKAFLQTDAETATGRIHLQNSTESLITVVINCFEEEGLGEATPCQLSNDDMALASIADEPVQI